MLDVRDLGFDYPLKPLLHGVRFTLLPGNLLHLRGGNGAGKTTLLKLLAGLYLPTEGSIFYCGHDILDDRAAYQQSLGFVGHKTGVSRLLTVQEQVRFDRDLLGLECPIDEVLASFALEGLRDIPCGLLSVGQQRRVGLLRIVLSSAPLWLLDEPLVGLDKDATSLFMDFVMKHLAKQGMVIMSSHQTLPCLRDTYQEYAL